ncbi:helix-turn-helix domain-containing protein [Aquabacterium sp. CECT 9606]|uniref:helix-turn-helix domain-containing protein n=1 Tax=Aquabacterium sp. CECT 9606 TaxID=2845822 RepID=UPI001E45C358|nr:helix-turn-helix domain-containing protein [Aquabacterium sp. CECT 9606]
MADLLQFPAALRQARSKRGLMQKTVAQRLNVDPTMLCSAEKGARGPLDAQILGKLAALLKLAPDEAKDLNWAAHHDRAIGALRRHGFTDIELLGISVILSALHGLHGDQQAGLIDYCRQVGQSARLVNSLTSNNQRAEDLT